MNAHSHRLFGRNRLRLAAIAITPALALTVFTLLSATPAYAYSCPASTVCTWQNSNYGGTQWNFVATSSHPRGYWWYVGNAANDQISSIVNSHTSYKAWFDKDCPASGQYTWVGTLQKAPNLANNKWPNGSSMNDSISAWGLDSTVPAHGSRPAGGC